MKRVADVQLVKDDHEDEPQEDGSDAFSGEMQRAGDAILATRKIRPLPKSRSAAFNTSSVNETTPTIIESQPPAPRVSFGTFNGFGAPSNNTTFTFTPTPPTSTAPSQPTSSFPFSMPGTTASFKSSTVSPLASSAFNAPKASTPKPVFTPLANPSASLFDGADKTQESDQVKLYSSLRGLNLSFLSAVSKAVEEDPFTDVGNLLQKYQSLRLDIRQDYDKRSSGAKINLPTFSTGNTSAQAKPFTMPTPPTSLFPTFSRQKHKDSKESASDSDKASSPLPSLPFAFPPALGVAPPSSSVPQSALGFSFAKIPSNPAVSDLKPAFSGFGGFGSPAITSGAGQSIGFSFASSSAPGNLPPGPVTGFGLSKPLVGKDQNVQEDSGEGAGTDDTQDSQGSQDGILAPTSGPNTHDGEGEGEEEEETLHSVKAKAYRLKSNDEKGGPGWIEQGVGMLRLKKHKETHKRRVLLRNSSTGKINLNFNLYADMKPSHTKKTVTFVGHDGEKSQTYTLRLPTEDDAKILKEALDRESAVVKANDNH